MPPDNLGLFDTPPSRKQIRYSLAIVAILLLVLVLVLTVPDVEVGQIDAFIPMVGATTTLVDLIIATLLFVQASVFRSRALGALATGYVFTGLILIPHMLTFPGAFAPDGLLGAGVSTTAWIYIFWRTGLPIAVILYVLFNRSDAAAPLNRERPAGQARIAVFAVVGLVVLLTILATAGHDLLPQLYLSRAVSNYPNMIRANVAVITLAAVSAAFLFRERRSALDIWLLVVMAAWLVQTLLFLSFKGRFTAAWYFTDVVVLLSHLYLMLGLIAESSRLYARLALTTALRNREREARLMSMDGMTAAIAHEVGQPLSAVILNATATLTWLTRDRPEVEKAIITARDIIRDGQRTFDVIKSVRAMFAKRPGTATEFDLNDLIREAAALRSLEFDNAKIALLLELDPDLPFIIADRVQLQRVLVNLLTNAIESLGATKRRRRKIVIRSLAQGHRDVLLEIRDTGVGIAPEEVEHIFDPFFTTKATGTGLGLSLCRTIVEEHGGRLWASPGENNGAVFSMHLPQRGRRDY
ncbi:MAG: sensor histidine kinase [Sphingomicrobium sp.]